MSLTIRPFTPEDYPGAVAASNAAEPDYAGTVEEWKFNDTHRDPKCRWERFCALWDGVIVGVGGYGQSSGSYHPRKFYVSATVRPEFQGRGIGAALFKRTMDALDPFEPIRIRAGTQESRERAVRFLADRGFTETMREWESRLDVRAFDPAPYAGVEEKVRAHGIEILTFRELEADPDRNRKIHELENLVDRDVPSTETPTERPFEVFESRLQGNPGIQPDGWFIAVHEGRYVGESNLWKPQAGDYLDTGLTGVLREYRRKGIALALKLRAIEYARKVGAPEIRTWNASTNEGMLSINVRLGFVRQPAWIEYAKQLRDEE